MKKYLSPLIKLCVASGIIYLLISKGLLDLDKVKVILSPGYFIVLFLLLGLNIGFGHTRWWLLLRSQGFEISWLKLIPLTFIGFFFNYVVPGNVGGDLVKGYYLVKDNPERKMLAASTVIIDRVLGLYMMIFIAFATILLYWPSIQDRPVLLTVSSSVILLFLGVSLFLAMGFSQRFNQWIKVERIFSKLPGGQGIYKLYQTIASYRQYPKTLAWVLVLSICAQLTLIAFIYYVGWILQSPIPTSTYFFAAPLATILSAIPIAPAGVGVGQVAYLTLFKIYSGMDTQVGQMGITVFQILLFIWSLLGAVFYLGRSKQVPAIKEQALAQN